MNLNVKIKRQIDKIEPFIKDKKNRPILVLSSWVLCGLSLILYSHYTRFDINRLEKSSRKELKKDQSLDIDGLTEKLEQLESVNAIEYFKETKHLNISENSISLVEKFRLQEIARREAEKLKILKDQSIEQKILEAKKELAKQAADREIVGQTDLFGHWKTEDEIHLDSQKFFNKLHNNAFLVQDLSGLSVEAGSLKDKSSDFEDEYEGEELDHYDGFQEGITGLCGWVLVIRISYTRLYIFFGFLFQQKKKT